MESNFQDVFMCNCSIPYDCVTKILFQRSIGNKLPNYIPITTKKLDPPPTVISSGSSTCDGYLFRV